MNNLIEQYRNWILDIPEQTGDLIACGVYLVYLLALSGAAITFSTGAYVPMSFCLTAVFTIMLLIYIP